MPEDDSASASGNRFHGMPGVDDSTMRQFWKVAESAPFDAWLRENAAKMEIG